MNWTRRQILRAGAGVGASLLLPARAFAATDQLRVALTAEPRHLDPTAPGATASTMAIACQNLFEGLTSLDEGGKVLPGLAKSWTVSPDGRDYVFALQEGVRYHDGTSFDAAHVVFSLNRLRDAAAQNPQRALFDAVASVTAKDDATVEIILSPPDTALLFNLARAEAAIVASESADNNRNVPIGTGPFAFIQWDHGAQLPLARNEDYWGLHPRINQANFLFAPDAQSAVAALIAGQVDGVPNVPQALADSLRGNAALQVISGTGPDKQPRFSAWNAKLSGIQANLPVESCVLAGVRWADDNAPQQSGPSVQPPDGQINDE